MKRPENKSFIIIGGMLVAWVVFIAIGLAMRPEKANPVAEILAQFEAAQKALQNEDLRTLKALADMNAIASSVASDIVDIPDEQSAMGSAIVDNVAKSLLSEFETLMKDQAGEAPAPHTVLGQVYLSLVGSNSAQMHLKGVSVTDVVESSALITMTWQRDDVSLTFPLSMEMFVKDDLWTFGAVRGLEEAFEMINERQDALLEAKNKKILDALKNTVALDRAEISTAISTEEGGAPRVMLFMAVKNISEKDIKTYHATVSIADNEGTILKAFDLSDTDTFVSGKLTEKSWPIFLDIDDDFEKQILIKPAEELSISLNVNEVTYADGEVLMPLSKGERQGE